MAMRIGKRSLPALLPHPGIVITSPQSYKAVQSLRAFPRGLRSSSEVLHSQQVSKMCWRNPSREIPEPPVSQQKPALIARISSSWIPFHPRSLDGCTGKAGDEHEHRDSCTPLTASVIPLGSQDTSLSMKHNKIHLSRAASLQILKKVIC